MAPCFAGVAIRARPFEYAWTSRRSTVTAPLISFLLRRGGTRSPYSGANLDVWAANRFLDDLVRRADAAGIETWITADHGNLECLRAGALSEGTAIESAGKRLLRYPNRTLRDASAAMAIAWDDIPGMPSSTEPLLFAPGRLAFTNLQLSVSHGGLSIDEVIVPLVRVSA
jgi:hypothetical protein